MIKRNSPFTNDNAPPCVGCLLGLQLVGSARTWSVGGSPWRLWRRHVADVNADCVGHAGTSSDSSERLVRSAASIFVDCHQEPGLYQIHGWWKQGLDLSK